MTPILRQDVSANRPAYSRIGVDRINEEVDIIDIFAEAHNAAIAASVVNSLMRQYIAQDKEWRTGDIKQSLKYAEDEVKSARSRWDKAQLALSSFRQKEQISDFASQIAAKTNMVSTLQGKRDTTQQDLDNINKMIEVSQDQLAKLSPTVSKNSKATNLNLEKMGDDMMTLNAEYQGLLALFKPEHPKALAVKKKIDALEASLKKAPKDITVAEVSTNPEVRDMETKIRTMLATKAGIFSLLTRADSQLGQAQNELTKLGQRQSKLTTLTLDAEQDRDHLKRIQDRLDDLRLRDTAETKPINVLNEARAEADPVRPKKTLMLGMAMAAGLFLGVCFALLQEFLDDRVNAPEDARRLLNVPALGYIPRVEKDEQRMLTSEKASGSLLESYRVLRSNVRFAAVGEPLNSIMVTSTAPGEGKSMTSCNLAIAMALDGKRVILVDADLRRPTVHEKFGVRNTPGLTNVLVGALPLDKALQETEVENLQILTSGPIPPNPAELLNSSAMEQIQEMLKERCDVVIYDTPPCLSVADAQIMAATVDGLIYVVQVGSTRKSAIKHGNELLRQAHARILGCGLQQNAVGRQKRQLLLRLL